MTNLLKLLKPIFVNFIVDMINAVTNVLIQKIRVSFAWFFYSAGVVNLSLTPAEVTPIISTLLMQLNVASQIHHQVQLLLGN